MSLTAMSFQARARTVDHLGREQIADCPTAVSELWKNSYDAYARQVSLHLYDGESPIAALVDDGHGMSRQEFVDKWLVIGTESKLQGEVPTPEADRNGLPIRQRQGQKGIGRLSAGALGPLLLVVSKRKTQPFVASLLDWRIFENPYIFLNDVVIPVVEFVDRDELFKLLPSMFDKLMSNVWGDAQDKERDVRLVKAWRKLDEIDANEDRPSVRGSIENALVAADFSPRHLECWPVWSGDSPCGTAMLMADLAFDLQSLLPSRISPADNQTAEHARNRLFETLSGFTDPFVSANELGSSYAAPEFRYSVVAWEGELRRTVVSNEREFRYENLEQLEHIVEGVVDASGTFKGRVRAFGKWLEATVEIAPSAAVPTRIDSKVGPFHLRLASFELDPAGSSHPAEIHSKLLEQIGLYAGFMVYRNGLRVMPYGREDSDFFEIEKRRSKHAGREFWSFRRIFGRVALTREQNPNLKDKAGREGLIDNKAAKVFRDIVEHILMTTARRFFGTDAPTRKDLLPAIRESRQAERAREGAGRLRARKRREFRTKLRAHLEPIRQLRAELEALAEIARTDKLPKDADGLVTLRARVSGLKENRSELSIGAAPRPLGSLESEYRDYRSESARVNELILQLDDSLAVAIERISPRLPKDVAYSQLNRNAAFLQGRVRKWAARARQLLSDELDRLNGLVEEKNKQYHAETLPLIGDLEAGRVQLSNALRSLDDAKERLHQQNEELFDAYTSILQSLRDNLDLDALVSLSMAESEEAREEIDRLTSLAQLGITVEIVGHEIEGLEVAISQGLSDLSRTAVRDPAYLRVKTAHEQLSERLKFLSPLRLSGDKANTWISGQEIYNYVDSFLAKAIEASGAAIVATPDFLGFRVYDRPSRILPVFVNLINNAIYWIGQTQSAEKCVLLTVKNGSVFVADSGPGVDPEDVGHLFRLFFTKKVRGGRGVGLYLCRSNLAASGHTISYESEVRSKVLSGANFKITFQRAEYV